MEKPGVSSKEVTGLFQTATGAITHPMLDFTHYPGKWVGKKGDPKRHWVPSERFKDGIHWSFPAWFVAIVGISLLVTALGGISKIFEGVMPTKKEKKAIEDVKFVIGAGPLGLLGL